MLGVASRKLLLRVFGENFRRFLALKLLKLVLVRLIRFHELYFKFFIAFTSLFLLPKCIRKGNAKQTLRIYSMI